jgi:hypothetical protein
MWKNFVCSVHLECQFVFFCSSVGEVSILLGLWCYVAWCFIPKLLRPLHFLKTPGTKYPVMQHHVPEEWIPPVKFKYLCCITFQKLPLLLSSGKSVKPPLLGQLDGTVVCYQLRLAVSNWPSSVGCLLFPKTKASKMYLLSKTRQWRMLGTLVNLSNIVCYV